MSLPRCFYVLSITIYKIFIVVKVLLEERGTHIYLILIIILIIKHLFSNQKR